MIERVDSDNTSTSISVKKPVQPSSQPKATTVSQLVSNVKSWSDDTTSAPPIKPKAEPRSNSWDTSVSDDEDATLSKSKEPPKSLPKPLTLSTSIINVSSSDTDDDNSVDTEIRKLDLDKSLPSKGIENLVNKSVGGGYKVVGISEVQSPVSEDSSWSTSLVPFNQSAPAKPAQTIVQADDSTWDDDSRPLSTHLSPRVTTATTATGVENLMKIINDVKQSHQKRPSETVIGKLVVSSMTDRTDSISSGIDQHPPTIDKKKSEEWSTSTTNEKKPKTFIQPIVRESPSSSSTFPDVRTHFSSFFSFSLLRLSGSIERIKRKYQTSRRKSRRYSRFKTSITRHGNAKE